MKLRTYLQNVVAYFRDQRVVRNIERLVAQIIAHKTLKLWTLAQDKREFARFKSLLDGSLKAELTVAQLRPELHAQSVATHGDQKSVILLHDPCDIRKPYMQTAENLGRVRNLAGNIINGYSTFNTVTVNEQGQDLQLSDITVYSNRDAHYVRVQELQQFQQQKLQNSTAAAVRARAAQIATYVTADSCLNLPKLVRAQAQRVSQAFKAHNPRIRLRHVFDRQFDGLPYFKFLDLELHDEFVIRLKISRNSNTETSEEDTQQVHAVKLLHVVFAHRQQFIVPKLKLHGKLYQHAKCEVEWDTLTLEEQTYTVVRITLRDRKGTALFKHPMLLISNVPVQTATQARALYLTYLLRAKIEAVFKFLKDVVGWEEFQVQDYTTICNLVALGYFVGGYFYALEPELTEQPLLAHIAQLGGGKGQVSRHYLVAGFKKLLNYCNVMRFLHEQQLDELTFAEMLSFIT